MELPGYNTLLAAETGQALQGIQTNTAQAKVDELSLFFGLTVDLIKQ
jgi:hypothetical protein